MVTATNPPRARAFREMVYQLGQQRAARNVAYLCMEYGLNPDLPIYSGGLGVLAGDTVKSAADRGLPMVAVGLLYRDGYFAQRIVSGHQRQDVQRWNPSKFPGLIDLQEGVSVPIAGRDVKLRLWGYTQQGINGKMVPLILLDSIGAPNSHFSETTSQLYKAGTWERLTQEMVLGIGGVRALEWCGIPVAYYHLNEGHAAFATIEVLRRLGKAFENVSPEDMEQVRRLFSFTTHTPVPAGFDKFEIDQVNFAFSDAFLRTAAVALGRDPVNQSFINMAILAMRLSGVRNGVSLLHARVSEEMFPDFRPIIGITNGVHHLTWIAKPTAGLLDEYASGWQSDPARLAGLAEHKNDPEFREKLWQAHQENKRALLKLVRETNGVEISEEVFTIGFARRFATYKRGDLIFANEEELLKVAEAVGGLQLIFSGKAHPADGPGKDILTRVIAAGKKLSERSKGKIRCVFVPNYSMEIGARLTAGVDAWLNTPLRPHEASGTSGMKAALNGVPNISVEDGWWAESQGGGWTIGNKEQKPSDADPQLYLADSTDLYRVIRETATAYGNRAVDPVFIDKMIEELALNGSFFNTHRMVEEYYERVWQPRLTSPAGPEKAPPEPELALSEIMLHLGKIAFALATASNDTEIESLTAGNILKMMPGSRCVTRYDAHHESVRIERRWIGTRFGETVYEESRSEIGRSGFDHWLTLQQFTGEVMADLLRTKTIQVVVDPKQDPRCYRDGKLVSAEPFILVPEIVNGEIRGAFKIDFSAGKLSGGEKQFAYLNALMEVAGAAMARRLVGALLEDFSGYKTEAEVINWALVLMTAGGFVDMPRYAVESNRAAVFLFNENGELEGKQAIGDSTEAEHGRNLAAANETLYRDGAQGYLRKLDQSGSSLNRHFRGKLLGTYAVTTPLKVQDGIDIFNLLDFNGAFDSRRLRELKNAVESLFQVNGKTIDNYLLLPIQGPDGKVYGLVYVDNAFSADRPLAPEKYLAIINAAVRRLAEKK